MLQFALQFLMLLSGWWCRPVFLSLDFLIWVIEIIPCLRGCKLDPSLKDSISYSYYLFIAWIFKSISLWRSIRLTCNTNPQKFLPTLWITEIPPRPHTTSQRQNSPNCHFNLVLISSDDPPDPHYENPPQVFQSGQQTFRMEGYLSNL